ncbi:MAG TPA: hypothetical protein VFE57_00805 [Cyclobacteriaceae bacterium]|nr:hypothetical protein [Cyclobacteriaceae bacterium]
MEEKISLKAVDHYSEVYATSLCTSFFGQHEKITGQQILQLCEVKQVNLFIIRELLKTWKLESQKLKSPFFDYQSKEVKDALANFQNVLSNHIAISKSDFLPLLKKAVNQTLFLVLDPYDFYSETLDGRGQGFIKIEELKNDIKYIKINPAPLESLLLKLEEKKLDLISGNEAFALLDHILEEVNFTPEDIEGYINTFSKIEPLTIEKLYGSKPESKPKNVVREPAKVQVTVPVSAPGKTAVVNNFQRIARIKDSLTINQKFMFTKMLFHGDFELFSKAIDHLDRLESHQSALTYLEKNFTDWDNESEEYEEFLSLIEKRFS